MLVTEVFVESDLVRIPGLSRYRGKVVEIQVSDVEEAGNRETSLEPFMNLAGKIELDEGAGDELRSENIRGAGR